jgi:hypothetical protein
MPSPWIVKAVALMYWKMAVSACRLVCHDRRQISLYRLEERLNCRVVVTIAFAAHRHLEPVLAQYLLVVI